MSCTIFTSSAATAAMPPNLHLRGFLEHGAIAWPSAGSQTPQLLLSHRTVPTDVIVDGRLVVFDHARGREPGRRPVAATRSAMH